MTIREWLPVEAISTDRVASACAPTLAAWRDHWFTATLGSLVVKEGAGGRTRWSSVCQGEGFLLSLDDRARQLLLDSLLGPAPSGTGPSNADRLALDALILAVTRDLTDRLVRLAQAASGGTVPSRHFDICASAGPLVRISAGNDWLIRLVRASLASVPREQALVSLKVALGGCSIAVAAELGRAEIEIDELEALAVGDVVPLATPVGAPIQLHLAGSPAIIGRGILADSNGRNAVQITG